MIGLAAFVLVVAAVTSVVLDYRLPQRMWEAMK